MENLFANTGIGKYIIRTHHWGIVLPTLEKAEAFMKTFGLQEDYRGHVKAYDSDLIFTKHGNGVDAVEFIIPLSGVLTEFNKGKGGIAHVAYLVDDINAVSGEHFVLRRPWSCRQVSPKSRCRAARRCRLASRI